MNLNNEMKTELTAKYLGSHVYYTLDNYLREGVVIRCGYNDAWMPDKYINFYDRNFVVIRDLETNKKYRRGANQVSIVENALTSRISQVFRNKQTIVKNEELNSDKVQENHLFNSTKQNNDRSNDFVHKDLTKDVVNNSNVAFSEEKNTSDILTPIEIPPSLFLKMKRIARLKKLNLSEMLNLLFDKDLSGPEIPYPSDKKRDSDLYLE